MRAAIRRGMRIICEDIPDPVPGEGQVLVRTCACGICGSDLHALKFADVVSALGRSVGADNPMDPAQDVVFGHEFSAEILDHGPGTERRLKPGTLVVSMPVLIDRSGLHSVGYSNRFPGGYAERMLLSERFLLPVPNGLSAEHAALTEPMAVGEHAVARADLTDAAAALVVGCGPVGLAVIAALKARGFGPVIAADFASGRRAMAERLGADSVVDPAQASPHQGWAEAGVPRSRAERNQILATGGKPGRAVIFECVGVPGVLQDIIASAPPGSMVVVVGVCMQTDRIEPSLALAKELDLRFCYAYTPQEFAQSLRNIAEGRIDVVPLITGRVGIDGVSGAFEALAEPGAQVKILVAPE